MNLQAMLAERAEAGKPVRVGLIGAGKFGSMFLAQVPYIKGIEVAVIADLDPDRAKAACRTVGWDSPRIARTRFVADGRNACRADNVDVVVEATGNPAAGIAHALEAIEAKTPIVMVNVEADALAGVACRQGPRRGRDLFHGLWRPAGADRRNGRLGARGRFFRCRSRQRNQISAGLSRRDARSCLGALRPDRRGSSQGRHELADVQLVS